MRDQPDTLNYELIDQDVRPLVFFLRSYGFRTIHSCQGGPPGSGHAHRFPVIKMYADRDSTLEATKDRLDILLSQARPLGYTAFKTDIQRPVRNFPPVLVLYPAYSITVAVMPLPAATRRPET